VADNPPRGGYVEDRKIDNKPKLNNCGDSRYIPGMTTAHAAVCRWLKNRLAENANSGRAYTRQWLAGEVAFTNFKNTKKGFKL
jgi:hypothetical protein